MRVFILKTDTHWGDEESLLKTIGVFSSVAELSRAINSLPVPYGRKKLLKDQDYFVSHYILNKTYNQGESK